MKKILLALALAASILLCGCSSEAEKANYNISKQADYFESERKITGTHTDPYHYKLYFHTDILPSVEVKP